MTYGEAKNAALQLINQYSIAGENIETSYNNQSDYIKRMPFLVNDAQVQIATYGKKIPESIELGYLYSEEHGRFTMYTMPDDFFEFRGFNVLVFHDKWTERVPFVRTAGRNQFVVPTKLPDDAVVEYNRMPELLSATPNDTDYLDNTPDAQQLIPYFVAAHLVMGDDAYQHAALYNEYETRLSRLTTQRTWEVAEIHDAYAFEHNGIYEA